MPFYNTDILMSKHLETILHIKLLLTALLSVETQTLKCINIRLWLSYFMHLYFFVAFVQLGPLGRAHYIGAIFENFSDYKCAIFRIKTAHNFIYPIQTRNNSVFLIGEVHNDICS